jgi:hypothetical protein
MVEGPYPIMLGEKVDELGNTALRVTGCSKGSIQPVHMSIGECPLESDHGHEPSWFIECIRLFQAHEPVMYVRRFLKIVAMIGHSQEVQQCKIPCVLECV